VLDSQYSYCDVVWAVGLASVLEVGHSVQQLFLGWPVSTAIMMWVGQAVQVLCCVLDIQYSDCVVGCTFIIAILVWAGSSVKQLCCGLAVSTAMML